jgi:hypothetical protein
VFRQLENSELVHVASRDQLEQAVKLVEALRESFPCEYVVGDSEENDEELIAALTAGRRRVRASDGDST